MPCLLDMSRFVWFSFPKEGFFYFRDQKETYSCAYQRLKIFLKNTASPKICERTWVNLKNHNFSASVFFFSGPHSICLLDQVVNCVLKKYLLICYYPFQDNGRSSHPVLLKQINCFFITTVQSAGGSRVLEEPESGLTFRSEC
jgi:hypothetical protein